MACILPAVQPEVLNEEDTLASQGPQTFLQLPVSGVVKGRAMGVMPPPPRRGKIKKHFGALFEKLCVNTSIKYAVKSDDFSCLEGLP